MPVCFRQPAETGPIATLSHGPFSLGVAPQFGGRLVWFDCEGRPILRRTPDAVLARPKVYEFAGFPLFPYSGPLFGPGMSFGETFFPLERTVKEEPTATHGHGWIGPWEITEQTSRQIALQMDFEPAPGTFPFRWRGLIRYGLSDEGLSIGLELISKDHRLMPCGIGFHPYFPKPPGTRLQFESVAVWPPDAPEAAVLGCGPLEDGLSFNTGPDVSDMVVDRLYEGWDGRAELTYPDGSQTIVTADGALDKMQIYSPWYYPYVCVEPVSNANDCFNRMGNAIPGHGVRVLEPNRSIKGTIRILVDPVASH
jgi:aldose 1-epimerase